MTTTVPTSAVQPAPVPRRAGLGRVGLYVLLVIAALFFLLPIYLLIATALKTPDAINLATTWQWPRLLNWDSFVQAWGKIGGNVGNSLFLAVVSTILAALLGSLNGYALSKWQFRGANTLFALMLFGMFIPYQAVLIPLFQFVKSLGLYGSIWGLILAHVVYGLPITTLIFRNYYAEVPDALVEAATIDGAGFWSIYRQVILPLSVPAFVVVVIWEFTQVWNEFLFAATLTNTSSQPVTYALSQLAGGQAVSWNLPMAGAILAALPTLLVYILLGRYFVRGLLAGSVKG
ncbi:carbohydrate ABC transporter permease [Deinococcus metallilatus]|uniref:Carbohydrate ABC transporter permease n=1 Tax=Deinococcus metallilatus TaxID=1211322 RepID=A0AAJ5F0W8_9DEIO|nr:carbohydrate ABC transporter permease [Deinococcus metallilatus]MBB5295266.1 glucose/mannose transport system permease protein [Deinococcus metallilatus]QBY08573.1 carbohydrate ABC transporter permease [Deinococcus metallilatus]RXJ10835.1 carbohydrate ABC transporter permease [Deinococcus metallilatus]TLK22170.1 carbohydrate ABC transporter permease [Deinococcus metallilatus]GMA15041.1 sugar ABC transporter permease [Deinococcus metallilatus]